MALIGGLAAAQLEHTRQPRRRVARKPLLLKSRLGTKRTGHPPARASRTPRVEMPPSQPPTAPHSLARISHFTCAICDTNFSAPTPLYHNHHAPNRRMVPAAELKRMAMAVHNYCAENARLLGQLGVVLAQRNIYCPAADATPPPQLGEMQ